jgi:hypothetical protein
MKIKTLIENITNHQGIKNIPIIIKNKPNLLTELKKINNTIIINNNLKKYPKLNFNNKKIIIFNNFDENNITIRNEIFENYFNFNNINNIIFIINDITKIDESLTNKFLIL